MAAGDAPTPKAEGNLAQRPFAHLLLYVHQQKLSGTLAVWPEQDGAPVRGQDRILVADGAPVAGRLLEPSSALDRGLLPLFGRRDAPWAFYELDLVGRGDGVVGGQVDPYALVAASLRGVTREDAVEAILGRFGEARLRLRPGLDLQRFRLTPQEQGFIELVRAEPQTAGELIRLAKDERMAKRLLYLLAITKGLEPWEGTRHKSSHSGAASSLRRQGTQPGTRRPTAEGDGGAATAPPSASAAGAASSAGATPAASPPASAGPAGPSAPAGRPSGPPKKRGGEPEPPPDPPDDLDPELVHRWNQITMRARSLEEQNYYQMLGVSKDASTSTIQEAYFELVKRWHPDRLPPELSDLRPWVDRIFHFLTEAKEALSDEETRAEYLKQVQAGGGTPKAEREVEAIVTAAMEFQKVEVLVRRREWEQALEILKEAQELAPDDPDYTAMEGWILFQEHPGKDAPYERMHRCFDRALELNPNSARAHHYKASTLKRQGDEDGALKHFKKAADLDPKNLEAVREVRLATMRGRTSKPPPGKKGAKKDDGLISKLFKKK